MLRGASGTSDVADVVDMNTSSPTSTSSGFTRVELIIALAGFLLLTIIGVWRIARCVNSDGYSSSAGSVDANHQKVQVAKRAERVARLQKDYAAALDRHHARFLADVESVAAAKFGDVRDGIPGVVKKFGTFSRCKDLLVTLVKDKMDKGNRTGQSIKRDLEADFYRGLYDAHDQVKACLITFLKDVEAERQTFRHELEVELDSLELPGDEAFRALLTDGGERIENCKCELLEGQIVAAISAVVEATCIRFTVSTITKILGKSAARMAGSAAVGAGAAVADGPFPFGDIIGGALVLGSTCWTAYDIWQATKVLPEELRKTLRAVVDDCEAKTINDFKNSGNEIYSAYRHVHN